MKGAIILEEECSIEAIPVTSIPNSNCCNVNNFIVFAVFELCFLKHEHLLVFPHWWKKQSIITNPSNNHSVIFLNSCTLSQVSTRWNIMLTTFSLTNENESHEPDPQSRIKYFYRLDEIVDRVFSTFYDSWFLYSGRRLQISDTHITTILILSSFCFDLEYPETSTIVICWELSFRFMFVSFSFFFFTWSACSSLSPCTSSPWCWCTRHVRFDVLLFW